MCTTHGLSALSTAPVRLLSFHQRGVTLAKLTGLRGDTDMLLAWGLFRDGVSAYVSLSLCVCMGMGMSAYLSGSLSLYA